jgi:nicotinate-nucleotide--dimethylbenzimidazole phosphoribosyltransferase
MTTLLEQMIATIGPASAAHADAARRRLATAGPGPVAELAIRLAAAQHATRLRVTRRALVVVAADHGVGAPGVDLGASHPTSSSLRSIAAGDAAVSGLARAAGATILAVDAGCAGGGIPDVVVAPGIAPTASILAGPAMSEADATAAVEAGIAIAVALAGDGVDVIGVGRLGLGAEVTSASIAAAVLRRPAVDVAATGEIAEVEAVLRRSIPTTPLGILAAVGAGDTAVLVGLMVGAASLAVPVVLDDHGTVAAAIVAAALTPDVVGYLVASQGGSIPAQRVMLESLGFSALVGSSIGHGDGSGAAMVLALLESARTILDH